MKSINIKDYQIDPKNITNYAVKKTKKILDKDYQNIFNHDIQIFAQCNHPAIVPFIGFSVDNDNYHYVYHKKIEKGSLSDFLEKNRTTMSSFDDTKKYIISYGIALGMQYLHLNNITHGDLKSENIFLNNELYPFITDFGDLNKHDPNDSKITTKFAKMMAPEYIKDHELYKDSLSIDVYSFAIILYELWSNEEPYTTAKEPKDIYDLVTKDKRPKIPKKVPIKIRNMIRNSWSQSPEQRPKFDEIVKDFESSKFASSIFESTDYISFEKVFKKYQNYIMDNKMPSPERRPTYKRIKELEKLRNDANNADAIFNYITAQATEKYGSTDHSDVIEYGQTYLKDPETKNETWIEKNSKIELFLAKSFVAQQNYRGAENLLRRSMNHGEIESAYVLAELMYDQLIQQSRPNEMFSLYLFASQKGFLPAMKKFVFLNYNGYGSIKQNKINALTYIEKCSNMNDPEMMYKWAIRLEYGRDVVKNVKEAMKLMQSSADQGYTPAIIDLAIHLYNGYNGFQQDQSKAESLFKMAADKLDPEGNLYYSIVLMNKEEKSFKKYLKRAMHFKVPDAFGVYGFYCLGRKKIEKSNECLCEGAKGGSMIAMLGLAEYYKTVQNKGNPDEDKEKPEYYYEQASKCCHLVDKFGFFTPIKYDVYHCNICKVDICKGCAEICHKEHDKTKKVPMSGFKCQCGIKGFDQKCSEFVNPGGKFYQHFYQCTTCCMADDSQLICKACAEKCHKDHKICEVGIRRHFCSCGKDQLPYNFKCHCDGK